MTILSISIDLEGAVAHVSVTGAPSLILPHSHQICMMRAVLDSGQRGSEIRSKLSIMLDKSIRRARTGLLDDMCRQVDEALRADEERRRDASAGSPATVIAPPITERLRGPSMGSILAGGPGLLGKADDGK